MALSIAAVLALGSLFATPAQANSADSGPVSIVGDAIVGQTLSADVGTWDADTALTYQWSKVQVEPWLVTAIDGATSTFYELTEADLGFAYQLAVTGTLGASNISVSSGATNAVVEAPLPVLVAGTVSLAGSTAVGSVLTSASTGWPDGTDLTYTWGYSGGQYGDEIDGATGTTYTITDAMVGMTIVSLVTGTRDGFESSWANAFTETTVTAPQAPAAVAPVATSADLAAFLTKAGVETGTAASAGLPTGDLDSTKPYTATVDWFSGDSFVDVYAYSTPTLVGSFPVVDGKVQVVLSSAMLTSLASGTHTLVIAGQSSKAVQAVAFSVTAATAATAVTAAAATPSLAATGVNPILPLGSAVLLLLLGAALISLRRRRTLV